MKKFVATLFITALIAVNALGQSDPPPTLKIVTESPGLPSELFYGNIKVKPLRLRPGTTTPITIADYDFFIQQQYLDFLRRFPEAAGLKFYLDILNGCNPSDVECIKYTRGALAANFFRSPEFQRKGSFVMNLYMVSLGQRPSTDAELADPSKNTFERPHYSEFMADVQSISDPNDDLAVVNAKKDALTVAWLQRAEIQALYPGSMTNAAFVQALLNKAGVAIANQSALVADLDASRKTRAQVLREIVERPEVIAKFYKQAFVTMEYFGFQRRDPDLNGYVFHNNRYKQLEAVLTPDLTENFIVRGFIESPEYINRF
ncbi:MAG: hypothetical protein QOH25_1131 [Acidobacteriota bacterium]|jgi:hypothetical protein|nr:hypothetical protein [Acidobacteriota bacterium]